MNFSASNKTFLQFIPYTPHPTPYTHKPYKYRVYRYLCAIRAIQSLEIEQPVFMVGELVKFRFAAEESKIRTVLGIQLINGAWFYSIEWLSPALTAPEDMGICILPRSTNKPKVNPHLAWVTHYDLTGV